MPWGKLVGQDKLKGRVFAAFSKGNISSFLLVGTDGIGKKTIAREMAKLFLCENPTNDGACDNCNCCKYFEAGTLPDYKLISPIKGNKTIKLDSLRTEIIQDTVNMPQISRNKIYDIDASALTEAGQNLLLKSLEEPPKNVFFILRVTDKNLLLPTVLSRMTAIPIDSYSLENMALILKRNAEGYISDEDISFYTEFSSYIPGKAIELLSDDKIRDTRADVLKLVLSYPELSMTDLLYDWFEFFEKNKDNIRDILLLMLWIIEDLSILTVSPHNEDIKNKDMKSSLLDFISKHKYISIMSYSNITSHINHLYEGLKVNMNYNQAVNAMLIKISKELSK